MTLEDLLGAICASNPHDWNPIVTWGHRSGPSYLDQFIPTVQAGAFQLRHKQHAMRAAHLPDVRIGLAWGLDADNAFPDDTQELTADWSDTFPDKKWTAHFVDILYCGSLVHREMYADVDGGRAYLPIPDHELSVRQREYDLIRLLDSIGRHSEFESYVDRAGLTIR